MGTQGMRLRKKGASPLVHNPQALPKRPSPPGAQPGVLCVIQIGLCGFLLLLSFRICSYRFWIWIPYQIYKHRNYFSHSVGCAFSVDAQKFFIWMRSSLSVFTFVAFAFGSTFSVFIVFLKRLWFATLLL